MKFTRDIRIQRKKHKAQRNLEKILKHYSHNDLVIHLQVGSYLHRFCKDAKEEIHPDAYIQSYLIRVEDKTREIVG